jgi:hypothetical protein
LLASPWLACCGVEIVMAYVDRATHSSSDEPIPDVASIEHLAHDSSEYLRAWSVLFVAETRLARTSALRLAFAALVIPVLVLAICITVDALIVTLLNRWLHEWSLCIAITALLDLAGLCVLLVAMRHWWHNLSLPRSRGALTHLLGRMG